MYDKYYQIVVQTNRVTNIGKQSKLHQMDDYNTSSLLAEYRTPDMWQDNHDYIKFMNKVNKCKEKIHKIRDFLRILKKPFRLTFSSLLALFK